MRFQSNEVQTLKQLKLKVLEELQTLKQLHHEVFKCQALMNSGASYHQMGVEQTYRRRHKSLFGNSGYLLLKELKQVSILNLCF